MCIRIDIRKTPFSQRDIDSRRNMLKAGYLAYTVLIGIYAAAAIGRFHAAPDLCGIVLLPSLLAAVMVWVSSKRNLGALDALANSDLVRDFVMRSNPPEEVTTYLKAWSSLNRPIVRAEADALLKATHNLSIVDMGNPLLVR